MICMTYMNVDHYVAVRKPDRYGVMMSFNRSLCWIVLTWIIATSFCCPPLFSMHSNVKSYILIIAPLLVLSFFYYSFRALDHALA